MIESSANPDIKAARNKTIPIEVNEENPPPIFGIWKSLTIGVNVQGTVTGLTRLGKAKVAPSKDSTMLWPTDNSTSRKEKLTRMAESQIQADIVGASEFGEKMPSTHHISSTAMAMRHM